MNTGPVSPHYLGRAKQREKLARATYIAARNSAVYLAASSRMAPKTPNGNFRYAMDVERALCHAVEMREWYFIAVKHRKMCESRGTTPFGGRISPRAIARHNERYGKR